MKRIIATLASLKLTVGLLLVILVVLAVGTIFESLYGAERARAIYGSSVFYALLAAFAVNLSASLADRWPYGRFRIGYVITHGSMLLILIGSLTTLTVKVEGRLALWEGQHSNVIVGPPVDGKSPAVELPFTVRLDAFEIDVYAGTSRPAMFRSRVTVLDDRAGAELAAVIEMNRELSHGGYKFFQSSYRIEGQREMSILSVSRDPGQPIVFIGYGLLIFGMLTVLGTRVVQRQSNDIQPASHPAGPSLPTVLPAALIAVALGAALPAAAVTVPKAATVNQLHTLPVQHDGRVMPLDTLARESVRGVTGTTRWVRLDPAAMVLGWTFAPREWAAAPIIAIGDGDLAEAIGISRRIRYASFNDLVVNANLRQIVNQARIASQREEPLSSLQESGLELETRLVTLQSFLSRQAIRPLPVSDDPVDRWAVPEEMASAEDLVRVKDDLATDPPAIYPDSRTMAKEVRYNRVRPTRIAWLILVPAAAFAAISWRRANPWLDRLATVGLLAGFVVMSWGIAARWQAAGRIPASNMYESLLFMAWGVGLFAFVAALFIRNRLVIFNAGAMSALVILLVDVLPMDPFIHPMPPVLSGTPWLAIHVPIIMVSYSLLAIFSPDRAEAAATMDNTHYWYVQAGSILLIAGILTGSIWAASSWGRYWGWDPKEVWSLIAFLAYMAILHGRVDKWLSPFWAAAASIMAFGTILMTYLGVNYVLAAGLHSYGFGQSKVATWLVIAAVAETSFVVAGALAYHRNRKRLGSAGPGPTPATVEEATP
jgi:ABC-type transport system involved in cytochrome c biogenesis permease subunit